MAIKPLGDRLLVEIVDQEVNKVGSIYVPETAKEKPQLAKVVAIGEGRRTENNELIPMGLKVGDTVLFGKYSGTEIKHENTEYLILQGSDVLAIVD